MASSLLIGGLSAAASLVGSGAATGSDIYSTSTQLKATRETNQTNLKIANLAAENNLSQIQLSSDLSLRNAALAPILAYHSLVNMGADTEFAAKQASGITTSVGGVVRNFIPQSSQPTLPSRNVRPANYSIVPTVNSTIDAFQNSRVPSQAGFSNRNYGGSIRSLEWDYGTYASRGSSASFWSDNPIYRPPSSRSRISVMSSLGSDFSV